MDRVMFIKKYFKEEARSHGGYAVSFFLCEVLALVNVLLQMFLTDRHIHLFYFKYYSLNMKTI